ncbi:plastocyanin/azurin family copper-binding protein [Longimicrobium sp.]|uniref:plastocyanin/azurin family copper-binding protein n=1 Tax=Longimicrobium sp. TaxID=2029185 RepID=UPI002BC54C42|nr:plastocyanin/azurin family copper-binding protein [Longimicrobium sp.]HSU14294.1 plastocyanin/azurin family copper-binding protein [Longimicrobium sp.]
MMNLKIGSMLMAGALSLAALAPRHEARAAAPPVTHEVRMVMEGTTARFEPASLTIHAGDRVRFTNASGGPHNVSFDPARIPADAQRALAASMADQIQPLWGPLMTESGGSYTISFAGVKPGRYEFFCMPHMAMGMKGAITVQ